MSRTSKGHRAGPRIARPNTMLQRTSNASTASPGLKARATVRIGVPHRHHWGFDPLRTSIHGRIRAVQRLVWGSGCLGGALRRRLMTAPSDLRLPQGFQPNRGSSRTWASSSPRTLPAKNSRGRSDAAWDCTTPQCSGTPPAELRPECETRTGHGPGGMLRAPAGRCGAS